MLHAAIGKSSRYTRVTCLVIFWLQLGSARADFIVPSSFELYATHPEAINQPTERGRTIANITAFEGNLYAGYGDWALDTGPITIRSLHPTTAAWSSQLLNFGTEAISHYRQIDASLYAPNVDPRGLPGVNPGGFAIGVQGAGGVTWNQVDNVNGTHVFDINARSGSELWMAGSVGTQGSLWRSTDGGQSFSTVRLDGPASGQGSSVFSQYRGAGVLNENLYVQRIDVNGADVTSSMVFDGSTWSVGPDLLPDTNGLLFRPTGFLDELVYLDGDKSLGSFYRFDGAQAELAYSEKLKDFHVVNDRLYGLTEAAQLITTSDLEHWTVLGTVPEIASSLVVYEDSLFVGTSAGSILRASLPHVTAVPEPSSLALIGSAVAWLVYRKKRNSRKTVNFEISAVS